MENKILKTKNETYGFWGTTAVNYNKRGTEMRWKDAFETLMELSGKPAEDIREFLDSRVGRQLADQCYQRDVRKTILDKYYAYYEKQLFEEEDKKRIEIKKDRTGFGTLVLNTLTNSKDILLYTYKNQNRINQDYAVCIDAYENKYTIGMNYITPAEDKNEE